MVEAYPKMIDDNDNQEIDSAPLVREYVEILMTIISCFYYMFRSNAWRTFLIISG